MSLKNCCRLLPFLLKQTSSKSFMKPTFLHNQRQLLVSTHNLTNNIQVRYFFKDANKDDVEEGKERVYYGILTPQIRTVKWFSLTTSAIGIIGQPFLIKSLADVSSIPLIVAAYSVIGFFTFVTPMLLHFVTKKYVAHIDYNPEKGTYTAATVNFFCMLKETEFTPDDVKVPDIPGMFTTFIAKGKPMFMDARHFGNPSHYAKIMGYDKPIDFKMYETPAEDVKKK
ncbi:transmembrane protein 70 homolog, mitochondrial [Onthophagus taurus]|uniref:transmembrane protein 70 homolog, mitochondrial n=1 Tax=Onthophagus taurus TaxID=166361 RepID=UPI000C20D66C|nr:transmembrane protein 70 homolog, mitochondrial [Onthophagus taurus]XP_022911865.1 transmembrane protein 70 homolog, mitochondrial [Onthophagus taurus]